jgi:putative DNA primase/helicase
MPELTVAKNGQRLWILRAQNGGRDFKNSRLRPCFPLTSKSEARMNLRSLARALGGEVCGGQILAPGPDHSVKDRSLSVRLTADGFVVRSFCGDDPIACRDYVRERAGLPAFGKSERRPPAINKRRELRQSQQSSGGYALSLWAEAIDLRDTLAEKYLTGRGILTRENFSHAIRFHPACQFGKERFPALVSLIQNIETDKPQGIQRTALSPDGKAIKRGGTTFRMTLGLAKGGAVKVDEDAHVTQGLCIGEGLESTLAGRQMGYRPAWALLSAGGIAGFPTLPGLEGLTIFLENDDPNHGAANECGLRWREAGRDVFTLTPEAGNDLNDEICEAADGYSRRI